MEKVFASMPSFPALPSDRPLQKRTHSADEPGAPISERDEKSQEMV